MLYPLDYLLFSRARTKSRKLSKSISRALAFPDLPRRANNLIHASVEKVTMDLKSGMVSRHPLSTWNLDFAVINPAFVAVKNRYIYCGVGDPMPKISGVVKLDISLSEVDRRECIVASRMFGPDCFGGEPFFVAKEPENPDAAEDEGYIVSYVHNEITGESMFVVMDAKSPTLKIVAAVKLPHRVPYGFHEIRYRHSDGSDGLHGLNWHGYNEKKTWPVAMLDKSSFETSVKARTMGMYVPGVFTKLSGGCDVGSDASVPWMMTVVMVKFLDAKIKILEATSEMHLENHTLESAAAILHELCNDMRKLGVK
ncbi:carotenoid cleavage dioxygenase [Tanacetum coccineum]